MTYQLKISSQNQITLPNKLLTDIGAKSGQYVQIVKRGNKFVIQTFRDVLMDLDVLTKKIQIKTKKLSQNDPEFNLDKLIDESTTEFYATKK
jgi:bifunctional DNA-binding transcriptional regulator/antitoxin component of YhaV-PrlF toxin-antitoxin module